MNETRGTAPRRTRADGRDSRERILRAAAEIAGERGYEGTSISLVSERSGLPKSSIYWHFENKDDLIAAAIDDSYRRWSESLTRSESRADESRIGHSMAMLEQFPDFIRLGLLLVLEQQPTEPTARARFVEIRAEVRDRFARFLQQTNPELSDGDVEWLKRLAMVLTDGHFVAIDCGELTVDECVASVTEAFSTALGERLSRHESPARG